MHKLGDALRGVFGGATSMLALHVYALYMLAVAQPVFDLIQRNPEFLVVRRSHAEDILLLTAMVALAVPTMIVLVEILFGLILPPLQRMLHILVVADLAALLILPHLKNLDVSALAVVGGATAGGLLFALLYHTRAQARLLVTFMAPAILICPALFLALPPVSKLLDAPRQSNAPDGTPVIRPPLVVVLFDELPLLTLLDSKKQIDAGRFPHFAALAKESTWYRNATTVASRTEIAVPSILSGLYPSGEERVATVADFPQNLFSVFQHSYNLKVMEAVTYLNASQSGLHDGASQLPVLLSDCWIAYQHLMLPRSLTGHLPSINAAWSNFKLIPVPTSREPSRARHFIETLRPAANGRPPLYYAHFMPPHRPWNYLPSGQFFACVGEDGVATAGEWGDEPWDVTQGYQRHMLQVQFVDRILGEVMERLKTVKMYDEAVLVVTSDHGVTFQPKLPVREVNLQTADEVMRIPLFIKAAQQKAGVVDDRNVESVDLLPTLAHMLKQPLVTPVHGQSLMARPAPRAHKLCLNQRTLTRFDAELRQPMPLLDRKISWFGEGADPVRLFRVGPHGELVGQPVDRLAEGGQAAGTVTLHNAAAFEAVDPAAASLPVCVSGMAYLTGTAAADPPALAIALNGTVLATCPTIWVKPGEFRYSALLLPSGLRRGRNVPHVYQLVNRAGAVRLLRLPWKIELSASIGR